MVFWNLHMVTYHGFSCPCNTQFKTEPEVHVIRLTGRACTWRYYVSSADELRARPRCACSSVDSSAKFKKYTATMKMSIESKRSSAYSEHLRWRMFWQREALGYTYEIAVNMS